MEVKEVVAVEVVAACNGHFNGKTTNKLQLLRLEWIGALGKRN
jgi:hypothetical protein